jgi:hypothetical protein
MSMSPPCGPNEHASTNPDIGSIPFTEGVPRSRASPTRQILYGADRRCQASGHGPAFSRPSAVRHLCVRRLRRRFDSVLIRVAPMT